MFTLISKQKGFNFNFDGMNGLEVVNELSFKANKCKNECECDKFLEIIDCIDKWYKCFGICFILELIKKEVVLLKMEIIERKQSEEYLQKYIIENFEQIFPNYRFKAREYYLGSKERIDILAEEKSTHRDVIIELKSFYKKRDTNKQLLNYAKFFDDPILISVNHKGKELNNIIYMEMEH
ncbi:endonuclease NucS domain-containing protein [Clostridium perfringens]|uniref:endonuclease NucS domain-containing protein n=1 Tax=Clostridium perfringens TaxID=1502 RepID=UPI00096A95C0|nr:endonuclease NucS domain-containing protein [Clostridium perfringens]